ncbi:MAG TPA: DsbA family protein, partial [Alphaproteobacteria bacterium]|nr:DsbA family protein [Alphaproteobacteria bacterium]
HNALMSHSGPLSDTVIMDLAGQSGIDKDKLKKDMDGPEVTARLQTSMDLASAIGAHGTPTFIIGDKVVPGAMSLEEMKKMIAEIRERKKT